MRGLVVNAVVCALLAGPVAAQTGASGPAPADLIVTAAHIYTVDPDRPTVEALAVRGGLIAFAGSVREAMALKGPRTRLLDLGTSTVIPGIVDAHLHLLGVGEALREVNLTGAASYEEVIRRVAARARDARPGEWIRGRGWNQNDWPGKQFPTEGPLSRAVPEHPVLLERVDGHAVLGNARALQLAGVTAATPDPVGGRIVRGADGTPTGVFVDNAEALLERAVPPLTRDETRDADPGRDSGGAPLGAHRDPRPRRDRADPRPV